VTWRGRSFQVRVAATGKARSPTVDSRVRRTDSNDVDAERRRLSVVKIDIEVNIEANEVWS